MKCKSKKLRTAIPVYCFAAILLLLPEVSNAAPIAFAGYGSETIVLGDAGEMRFLGTNGEVSRSFALHTRLTGMAVSGNTAYLTTEEPAGHVLALDLVSGEVSKRYRVGHTPMAPILSPDANTLYIANRFDKTVTLLNLATSQARTINVIREPFALALDPSGARLFVSNLLPEVRPFLDDENPFIAAQVSVIDTASGTVLAHIDLPNGSQSLRGITCSPDGRYMVVPHILSNYSVPAMAIKGGAMNRNAISLIDVKELYCAATVVLDEPDRGAANPWAAAFWTQAPQQNAEDTPYLLVTHAGTHEMSIIPLAKLLARIAERGASEEYFDDTAFNLLKGIRRRIALPVNGPRALFVRKNTFYAAGYFSGNIATLDFSNGTAAPTLQPLTIPGSDDSAHYASPASIGERYFNDAVACFQGWQSCASCHPDGRSDALYWDLLNDGMGNTKNTKSLLMATLTPPAMWRGVRSDAGMAIRAGIEHIQFAAPKPGQAEAIEAYLAEMKATPSPYLDAFHLESPKTENLSCGKCHSPGVPRGTLTESAKRGKALFEGKAGCMTCHPHPYFTTMKSCDPGLGNQTVYDIPSLIGVWRTAPYLHNGDAHTIKETITNFNYLHLRGNTQDLTEAELADLVMYIRSL